MKIVKVKKTTYEVIDISPKPFTTFGEFRTVRERLGLSVQKTCFNCSKKFANDDNIYFACIKPVGNRFLCKECAEKAAKDLNKTLEDKL